MSNVQQGWLAAAYIVALLLFAFGGLAWVFSLDEPDAALRNHILTEEQQP